MHCFSRLGKKNTCIINTKQVGFCMTRSSKSGCFLTLLHAFHATQSKILTICNLSARSEALKILRLIHNFLLKNTEYTRQIAKKVLRDFSYGFWTTAVVLCFKMERFPWFPLDTSWGKRSVEAT